MLVSKGAAVYTLHVRTDFNAQLMKVWRPMTALGSLFPA